MQYHRRMNTPLSKDERIIHASAIDLPGISGIIRQKRHRQLTAFCIPEMLNYFAEKNFMISAPYPLSMISGSIGKKIVVRQYRNGTVISKYPDMNNIVASEGQKNCRNLFKEAVAFARSINNTPAKKAEYMQKVQRGKTVYNMAVKEYMLQAKKGV